VERVIARLRRNVRAYRSRTTNRDAP
jgi:hypothetical protein